MVCCKCHWLLGSTWEAPFFWVNEEFGHERVLHNPLAHESWKFFRRTGRLLQPIWINMHEWKKQTSDFSATSLPPRVTDVSFCMHPPHFGLNHGWSCGCGMLWPGAKAPSVERHLLQGVGVCLFNLISKVHCEHQIGWLGWRLHLFTPWKLLHFHIRQAHVMKKDSQMQDVATMDFSNTWGTQNKVHYKGTVHDSCYIFAYACHIYN